MIPTIGLILCAYACFRALECSCREKTYGGFRWLVVVAGLALMALAGLAGLDFLSAMLAGVER